jgi:hypothetical protein
MPSIGAVASLPAVLCGGPARPNDYGAKNGRSPVGPDGRPGGPVGPDGRPGGRGHFFTPTNSGTSSQTQFYLRLSSVRLPATPHHLAGLSAVQYLLAEAPRVAGQAPNSPFGAVSATVDRCRKRTGMNSLLSQRDG